MTRRERAAMELALEALRSSARVQDGLTPTAGGIEAVSYLLVEEAALALAVGLSGLTRPLVDTQPEWGRLIRARLALYLRARLRADQGMRSPLGWGCEACDWRFDGSPTPSDFCDCDAPIVRVALPVRPLWQQAPATGMWRHRCADGRPVDLPRGETCPECGGTRADHG